MACCLDVNRQSGCLVNVPVSRSVKDVELPRHALGSACLERREQEEEKGAGVIRISSPAEEEANALGREADVHFAAQEYQKAYVAYSDAIRVAPSAPLRSGRAAALLLLGRPRAALFEAKEALTLDPSSCTGLIKKAQAHLELLEFDKALKATQSARKSCQEDQGQFLQALQLLEEAVERRRAVHVCALPTRVPSGASAHACLQQAIDVVVACVEETSRSFTLAQLATARNEAVQVLPGLHAVCRGHAAARAAAQAQPGDTCHAAQRALAQYRASADMGCAEGMYRLALCYRDGLGCKQDLRLFWQWVRKAAVQMPYQASGCLNPGVAAAENAIGVSYREGLGVAEDAAQALVWFELAAGHGDADGCNNLGRALLLAEDFQSAAREFRKAAGQGHVDAIKNLARTVVLLGDDNDLARFDFWLQNASGKGQVAMPMTLALLQATGSQLLDIPDLEVAQANAVRAVEENPNDAGSLRHMAALLLHLEHLNKAGMHEALLLDPNESTAAARCEADLPKQRPMTESEAQAMALLTRSARLNDTMSQILLAILLESVGLWRKAVKWWEIAAEARSADAAYRLAVLLSFSATDSSAAGDLHKSLAWLEKAVIWGSLDARWEYSELRDRVLRQKLLGEWPGGEWSGNYLLEVPLAEKIEPSWLHGFAAPESTLLPRLAELEEYIASQEEPSRTSMQLLKALNCFEESLYSLFSCHDHAVDLLFLAYMYDGKACELTRTVAECFVTIAAQRSSQSENELDVPAAVVAVQASREKEYDFQEKASMYSDCIDTLKAPPLRKAWAPWLPRFYELRAFCYKRQKCWKAAVEDYAAEAELDPTCCAAIYGIAELCQERGDQRDARREFQRYLGLSKPDEENRPHAHYKLAQLAIRDGDLVETKRQLTLAQRAEDCRLVLLGRLDDQSFPLKSATTESYLARLQGQKVISSPRRKHAYGHRICAG